MDRLLRYVRKRLRFASKNYLSYYISDNIKTLFKGVQKRDVYCVDQESNQRVDDESCEGINATKPEFEKPCETVDCEPE